MHQVPSPATEEMIERLRSLVRESPHVRPVGAGTKDALVRLDAPGRVSVGALCGVLDYEPMEFMITAHAGTPLAELDRVLAEQDQYLPFDPPLVLQGATLGGTVAAGLSGAGRLRFGGVRDFVLAVRLIDGLGTLITGGGKVVKNAAGFDLPKLMVGSCGRLGILTEVTLKVFPRPERLRTVQLTCRDLADAVATQNRLASAPLDLDALDIAPPDTLWVRVAGPDQAIERLAHRVARLADRPSEILSGEEDQARVWRPLQDWSWVAPGDRLVKVPVTPSRILPLDQQLEQWIVPRRYSVAGNVAWIRWPSERPIGQFDGALSALALSGLVLRGEVPDPRLGIRRGEGFARKIHAALDPDGRFG